MQAIVAASVQQTGQQPKVGGMQRLRVAGHVVRATSQHFNVMRYAEARAEEERLAAERLRAERPLLIALRTRLVALLTPPPPRKHGTKTPQEHLRIMRMRQQRLIDPRTSTFATFWDATATFALLFVALVTPFEVAFLPTAESAADALFVLNRLVDAIFCVDLVLNFFFMYLSFDPTSGTQWVDDPVRVAHHYLTGWFSLDLITILVSVFDILPMLDDSSSESSSVTQFRMMRLLRALRLVKLMRLVRASRIFKRFETKMSVRYSSLDIVKCLVLVVVTAHWSACAWGMQQAPLFVEDTTDTWASRLGYCVPEHALAAVDGDADVYVNVRGDSICVATADLYLASVHWALLLVVVVVVVVVVLTRNLAYHGRRACTGRFCS